MADPYYPHHQYGAPQSGPGPYDGSQYNQQGYYPPPQGQYGQSHQQGYYQPGVGQSNPLSAFRHNLFLSSRHKSTLLDSFPIFNLFALLASP